MDFNFNNIITALASSAAPAIILAWMIFKTNPQASERHNSTVLRIIEANKSERKEDHDMMIARIDKMSNAVLQLSRAVLISQFMSLGKTESEAERDAVRIISNGSA